MASSPTPAAIERPEHELLLCCARTGLGPEHAARLRALVQKKIDWSRLTDLAERHGLLPLLCTHLKAQAPDSVPHDALEALQRRFQDNQRNAMHLAGILVKLLELFEANRIPALTFKGPAVAEELYGNLALRPFADLDLILPHGEIPRAAELMFAQGFTADPGSAILLGARAMDTAGQFAFRSNEGTVLVELHSEVTLRHFPRRPDASFFFGSPATVVVAGRAVRTLDPTSLILSLCVHGAKDIWASLKWVVDLAEFLRVHAALEWRDVLRRAEDLRTERMLRLGFLLAERLLGVQLPEELRRSCEADRQARRLATRLAAGLLDEGQALSARERFEFRVRTHPRYWGGIRYAFRLALTPAEEDRAVSLPGPLPVLLRPLRLIRKYGAAGRSPSHPQ